MNEPGPPITAHELRGLLAELVPIGLDAEGATTRLAWTNEDRRAGEWFAQRSRELGRDVLRDPAGNLWSVPAQPAPWWAIASHLDSVSRGGRYDGALGVAVGFAVAAREPAAVIAFADEEGARFNTPTFGSRALAGTLDVEDVLERPDAEGVKLAEALTAAELDPLRLREATGWLSRLRGVLELHIDQSRELARRDRPVGIVGRLVARMRVQARVHGRADHAGTTLGQERHDALAAAARLIVLADDASASEGEMVFTATRIEVEPNAASTVPSLARLWLDARSPQPQRLLAWRGRLEGAAAAIAAERAVEVSLTQASWSQGTEFAAPVRAALAAGADASEGAHAAPEVVCWAGHDAGVLAQRLPSGMVLVRNPSGISHAPEEEVSLEDAAIGANVLQAALRELA